MKGDLVRLRQSNGSGNEWATKRGAAVTLEESSGNVAHSVEEEEQEEGEEHQKCCGAQDTAISELQ